MQPRNIQSPKNKTPTNGQTLKFGPKGGVGLGDKKQKLTLKDGTPITNGAKAKPVQAQNARA